MASCNKSPDFYTRVTDFALVLACKMLRYGSSVKSTERAITAVCTKFGAKNISTFCVPNAAALCASFEGRQYTALKRAYYGGNDLLVQEKCALIAGDILCGKITLEGAEKRLNAINKSVVSKKMQFAGSFLACGAFAVFFGGNAADGITAAVAGFITSFVSANLAKRGTGGCARVFLLSAISGFLSVIICAVLQLLCINCHTSVVLVGTLMTLIPGLTVCNALSDIISGELYSGAYRIFGGLSQTVCIVAGYAIALTAFGGISAFALLLQRTDVLHIIICYISCFIGAAGFCLTMIARGKRIFCGVAAAMASYTVYVIFRLLGLSEFVCYFAAAVMAYAAAEVPSRLVKIPSDVFVTPAVIPLLPGASMYFAVNALVCGDTGTAVACGSDALIIFTAIAAGLAAAQLFARIFLPDKKPML